jgi:hypothetical protein
MQQALLIPVAVTVQSANTAFKISNTNIMDTELLEFRTLSIVRILIITRKKNKHDVSETGSVSVLR